MLLASLVNPHGKIDTLLLHCTHSSSIRRRRGFTASATAVIEAKSKSRVLTITFCRPIEAASEQGTAYELFWDTGKHVSGNLPSHQEPGIPSRRRRPGCPLHLEHPSWLRQRLIEAAA